MLINSSRKKAVVFVLMFVQMDNTIEVVNFIPIVFCVILIVKLALINLNALLAKMGKYYQKADA